MQRHTELLRRLSEAVQRHPQDVAFVLGWFGANAPTEELERLLELIDEAHRLAPASGLQGLIDERWRR